MIKNIKEKVIETTGSVSGLASVMGSWQICHNVCLGLITLLSLIGITVAGMPLLFLNKFAIFFWFVAVSLFLITLWFYVKKRCILGKLVLLNSGFIIAGVPFVAQPFLSFFWIAGGLIVLLSIILFIKSKIRGKKHEIKIK